MARGAQFTDPTGDGRTPDDVKRMLEREEGFRARFFELACARLDVERRPTKSRRPWISEDRQTIRRIVSPTNGQVERMNRTIKDATVKRFHYSPHEEPRQHLADFVSACNLGRRLKTLTGLTPYEFIRNNRTAKPQRFTQNPLHQMPGPNR